MKQLTTTSIFRHALRRAGALLAIATAALVVACASAPPAAGPPPIVFVHGWGCHSGWWMTTIWRFESNGWPGERLYAINVPYPTSSAEYDKPQGGRTSTVEQMQFLAAEVEKVRATTGAEKVVLVGHSRGGNAIRNYIADGGGDKTVSHAILGASPNHGAFANPTDMLGSEFNGSGRFLTALNAPKGPNSDEATPGVKWMTIRSDNNDEYYQPVGGDGKPTNVTAASPELKGATNKVMPGFDHSQAAFHPLSFAETYTFITNRAPASTAIAIEATVILDGQLTGRGLNNTTGDYPNNLPLVGAAFEVYAVDAATGERLGPALHRKTIASDGQWGPFRADGKANYEFVISAPGFATTHIYRSPFPRSSNVVNLSGQRLKDSDKDALSVVALTRTAGYFAVPRDRISLDGMSPPAGIASGVPTENWVLRKITDTAGRAVAGEFNGERIVGRAWPAAENHVVRLELTY